MIEQKINNVRQTQDKISLPPLHKPKMKRESKMLLLVISHLLLSNTLLNTNRINNKKQLTLRTSLEFQKLIEVYITPGGFRVQSFWSNEHGITHQSGTKPPGRGQEAQQGEHEVDRIYKQWILRYAGFKNGQLGDGNRRPMKLLTRAIQPDELLSLVMQEKNAQIESILQSQKANPVYKT